MNGCNGDDQEMVDIVGGPPHPPGRIQKDVLGMSPYQLWGGCTGSFLFFVGWGGVFLEVSETLSGFVSPHTLKLAPQVFI